MKFTYQTSPEVCSNSIDIEVDDAQNIVAVSFNGGCPGSLLAVSKLVKGMSVAEAVKILENNRCGAKTTSCPDQLAKALKEKFKIQNSVNMCNMSKKTILLYPDGLDQFSKDDFSPYLELYPLDGGDNSTGMILVLPGGGYAARARHEAGVIAEKFNSLGFHAAVLQYRVYPNTYPAPLKDAVRAIKILRSRTDILFDREHLAISGFSAGGHLAGLTGICGGKFPENDPEFAGISGRPDAMLLCYPVVSLISDFGQLDTGFSLIGKNSTEAERRPYCLQNMIDDHTPPAFLWHTATDEVVPVENSVVFAKTMWQHGNTAELHIFNEGCHGLGIAENYPDICQWPKLAATFLTAKCGFKNA